MQHRRETDRAAVLRALAALLVACGLAGTVLAASGGKRDVVADVLQIARQQLGDTYQWGAEGPDLWDCSGFTSYLWREVGGVEDIPRVSRDQQAWAVPIPREQLRPGDLVFFGNPVTHVSLYAGMGQLVDASSSAGKVLERPLWFSGVVRYGRVPRKGMHRVTPWTPAPLPPPAAAAPAGASPARLVPLKGLPAPDLGPATGVARGAARNAQTVLGSRTWTDLDLVRVAWRHAGGRPLPGSMPALEQTSLAVPLRSARIGDLVLYGRPASHVGIYLGHGYMIDSSPSLRRVLVRRVFVSPTVRLVRPVG
ncbi:MAG: NlpC/P60 family protein [Actinobacteria bacterium]|nr:NlpC/P60 family protein [Actinomycetota bacterium]MCA1719990.1 NlpC/P60 family protein [Actinomycetota bacterium]